MTNQFLKSKNLFFIYLIYLSLFFPLWQNGELYYDDWSVAETGNLTNLKTAIAGYLNGFITRPIAAIILGIFSQINHNFQLIFFINISIWFLFCLIVTNVFYKLTEKNFANSLFLLILFPSFCITNLISPYAQSLGTISIFFWSISFLFSYKYCETKNKKYIFYAILLFILSVLTYETSFTLVILNFLLKYLYKNKSIKFNLTIFSSNKKEILILFFVTLLIVIYQKIIVNYLPYEGSNRYRLSFSKEFFYIILENKDIPLILLIDSFKLLIEASIRIFEINFYLIPLFFLILISLNSTIKININYIYIVNFVIFILLFILFFIIAASLPTIYGYYNRAMSSYNFIFFLTLLSLIIIFVKKIYLRKIIVTILISLNFICFFIQIQNHSYASAERKIISKEINNIIQINKKNVFVFALLPTKLKNDFNGEFIFSEEVMDFNRSLRFYSKNRISGKRIYKNNECDKILKNENQKFLMTVPSRSRKDKKPIQDAVLKKFDHYFIYDYEDKSLIELNNQNVQKILFNKNYCKST